MTKTNLNLFGGYGMGDGLTKKIIKEIKREVFNELFKSDIRSHIPESFDRKDVFLEHGIGVPTFDEMDELFRNR